MIRLRPLPPLRWWLGWIAAPALVAVTLSANVDRSAPPIVGPERLSAVLLLDGQAYFGRLEEPPFSDAIVLRDVFYLADARNSSTNVPVALVQRGTEIHSPADGMRIRRERVLAIERVGPASQVAAAIAAQRALGGARP